MATLPRVGALLDPDVERILSLRPDLVIVYGIADRPRGAARAGGHPHLQLSPRRARRRPPARSAISAALTGHAREGDRVARDLEAQLDAVRARGRGRPRPRTLLVFGRDALGALRGIYASGGVGFLHELLDVAGGDDVFADVNREAVQPSNETLLARAPHVILELHRR